MQRADIAENCAKATGLSPEKCDEAIGLMVDTIGAALQAGGLVMVDDFGTFGPMRSGRGQFFRPADVLKDRVAGGEEAEEEPEPRAPARDIAPLRHEDGALIDRWLAVRQGQPTRALESVLYPKPGARKRPLIFGSPMTVRRARSALRAFARRCDVPLAEVGLTRRADLGIYKDEALHREIFNYWRQYEAAALPRLERMRRIRQLEGGSHIPIAMRTQMWVKFVLYATDFYDWMIEEGLRPQGTSPMTGIAKASPFDYGRRKVVIVRDWYRTMLRHSPLGPRERAIMYLLSNGLRAEEVQFTRLEHLTLSRRVLTIIGKGSRRRDVILLPWVAEAIDAWLQARRMTTSSWLFPSRRRAGQPISYHAVYRTIAHLAARVFPADEQVRIRKRIHPHGFRHFYATESLDQGAFSKAVAAQMGHSQVETLNVYVTMDDQLVATQMAKVSKRRWF